MTARAIFVTGTDTGIGKTHVSARLLRALVAQGVRATGFKPVASGCVRDASGALASEDALALRAASVQPPPPYTTSNPYALEQPLSPHLAARLDGAEVKLGPILAAYDALAAAHDVVVVEGVGGWAVPLSQRLMQADLARALGVPILLVVGVRLGCINHALLTARAIASDGGRLLGWVANTIDPSLAQADGAIATIGDAVGEPCITRFAHDAADDDAAAQALARAVLRRTD
jgi:dethiobiotin synthetase